ncbi:hypothetical protein J2802_002220 [Paraburkholderia caribensis]|nr:hypothetical protein [Paraburkholderia caribensis]
MRGLIAFASLVLALFSLLWLASLVAQVCR